MTSPADLDQSAACWEKAAETASGADARENLIRAHGLRSEAAYARSGMPGADYFHFRGEADRHRLEMEALIRQRPAEFVGELPVLRRTLEAQS